jgi:hypothetical protein
MNTQPAQPVPLDHRSAEQSSTRLYHGVHDCPGTDLKIKYSVKGHDIT